MKVKEPGRLFRKKSENNFYRIFLYLFAMTAALAIYVGVNRGSIVAVGHQTPTPTRTSNSHIEEGNARFTSGDLNAAINSYQKALEIDPQNEHVWATLARVQTYDSALKTTDSDRLIALQNALYSIDQAKAIDPDSSEVSAIRAFVLDWLSSSTIDDQESDTYLVEAEQEAIRALTIDPNNVLALAYYAEILIDQQRLDQAEQNIGLALQSDDDLMDLYRINAYLLESQQKYTEAIAEYEKAININPNLTFLYVRAGANYRALAFNSPNETQSKEFYYRSLEYFDMAATINEQLGIQDPLPYLSIAKTYSQLGEFFGAARNVQKALEYDPSNPDIYGQLGIVFMRSRNYEGAIPALKCAVKGCTAEESCEARGGCPEGDLGTAITKLELSPGSIVYYYSYVSNLAALSIPQNNYCPEARDVIREIREAGYAEDPIVNQILTENENICRIVDGGALPTQIPVTLTPTLSPEQTPIP
ncbi:MAG TPA: tetratricopeptide repeat protein [Anaerolineales bacterium]|nr:tetratricopeptide repeat protein [Anaerolineales bacterium]